jgi:hypothetical protein
MEVGTQIFLGSTQLIGNSLYLGGNNALINPFEFLGYDADAQAFINVTGISGSNATAINDLVVSLKNNNNVWDSLLAIYPFVGGTSTTCKYNLKNPIDSDAAYRLNFSGSWTFDAGGATPNGSAGTYANTYVYPNTVPLSASSGSFSYYCPTQYAAGDVVDIGSGDFNSLGETTIATRWSDNNAYFIYYNSGATNGFYATANTTTTGYYIVNRYTTTLAGWKDGTKLGTGVNGSNTNNYPLFLGARNINTANGDRNSPRKHVFDTIGQGLSDAQASSLSTAAAAFVSTLGKTF